VGKFLAHAFRESTHETGQALRRLFFLATQHLVVPAQAGTPFFLA
jgi:hypothetical protein